MNVLLNCAHCHKKFLQAKVEYKKNLSLGIKKPFCSFGCYKRTGKKTYRLKQVRKSIVDKYSPFKNMLSAARYRTKIKGLPPMNIDLPYLYWLWHQQRGICALSPGQVKMELPKSTTKPAAYSPFKASLDRSVPALGYVKGNVEFVCVSANYAKSDFSKESAIEYLRA